MSIKVLIFAAAVAAAQAGYIAPVTYGVASTAIGSSSQSTLRSLDGSSAISQYSKAVDTAYSSVRKTDTRITNDAKYITPLAATYHAPAYAAAPVVAKAYAPAVATYAAAPAVSAYHAPAYAPALAAPAYARSYAAPVVAKAYAPALAAPVAAHGLLGVAYSAAPAVAHVSYDSPIVHYAI